MSNIDFETAGTILRKYRGKDSNVVIPNSVTKIYDNAFAGCTSLTSVEIPNSVTEFEIDIFLGCDNVTVYCSSNSEAARYCEKNRIKFVATDFSDDKI